jgi:hypothetical protein
MLDCNEECIYNHKINNCTFWTFENPTHNCSLYEWVSGFSDDLIEQNDTVVGPFNCGI